MTPDEQAAADLELRDTNPEAWEKLHPFRRDHAVILGDLAASRRRTDGGL